MSGPTSIRGLLPPRPAIALCACMLVVLSVSCSGNGEASLADDRLIVFVSILPQKFFVERIGAGHVRTSVLVGPGESPATYEPRPRQVAQLADAAVYFAVGVPFERVWLPRLRQANPGMTVVALAPPADHHHDDTDPHVWTSPREALLMAATIRATLSATDPANAEAYAAGFAALREELVTLDEELRTLFRGSAGKAFLVFHPAWGHLAEAYGLEQIALEQGGKTPGAQRLAALIDEVRARGIDTLFVQPQFGGVQARRLAEELGVDVVTADPLADDYVANLRAVAAAIAEAAR